MSKRTFGTVIAVIGFLMILGAAGLTVMNVSTDNRAAEATSGILDRVLAEEASGAVQSHGGDAGDGNAVTPEYPMLPGQRRILDLIREPEMKTVLVDGREYIGVLKIPKTGSELPVMSTCTDRTINIAPGRYHGTPEGGAFVIGGHNYISHLGRIDWLKEGDEVLFTDVEGTTYLYSVVGSEVLDANAARELVDDEWDLSLFTCTFSGAQRLTVRCLRVNPEKDAE